jgi:hypothetical protein
MAKDRCQTIKTKSLFNQKPNTKKQPGIFFALFWRDNN